MYIIYSNHAMYHLIMYLICGIKPYDHMFIVIWKSCLCLDIKAIISLISCPNIYEAMVIINLYVYSNKLHRLSQIIYQKMKIPPLCFSEIRWLQGSMANVLSSTLMVTYGAGFGALFMKFLLTLMIYWERITWNNLLKYVYIAYLWYAWIDSTSSNSSLS